MSTTSSDDNDDSSVVAGAGGEHGDDHDQMTNDFTSVLAQYGFLKAHSDSVRCVSFLHESGGIHPVRFMSGGYDGMLHLWDCEHDGDEMVYWREYSRDMTSRTAMKREMLRAYNDAIVANMVTAHDSDNDGEYRHLGSRGNIHKWLRTYRRNRRWRPLSSVNVSHLLARDTTQRSIAGFFNPRSVYINACCALDNDSATAALSTRGGPIMVVDLEYNALVSQFSRMRGFSGYDRSFLVPLPDNNRNLVLAPTTNGKDVCLYDIRSSSQRECMRTVALHSAAIRDCQPLHSAWYNERTFMTASEDGTSKVVSLERNGEVIQTTQFGQPLYSCTATPERCDVSRDEPCLVFGGNASLQVYRATISTNVNMSPGDRQAPSNPILLRLHQFRHNPLRKPIWRVKYLPMGTHLLAACDDGKLRMYERWTDGSHTYNGEVLFHGTGRDDIEDLAVSACGSWAVTAGKDGLVGVIRMRSSGSMVAGATYTGEMF